MKEVAFEGPLETKTATGGLNVACIISVSVPACLLNSKQLL